MVLEKALESPLFCKEIQPVHPKGDQSWVFIGRTDVEAEILILWPPDEKSPNAGKDWGQEEKGTTEDEMFGWYHRLDGHGFGWTPGVGDGQGGLACCGSWDRRVGHDWATKLNWCVINILYFHLHLCIPVFYRSSFLINQLCMLSRVSLFCNLVDCSLPVSSIHWIFLARILEWVAISSSRGSSQPKDWTHISHVSYVVGGFFTTQPPVLVKYIV